MSPLIATNPINFKTVFKWQYGDDPFSAKTIAAIEKKNRVTDFQLYDKVRVKVKKEPFLKEAVSQYSSQIYEVSFIIRSTSPVMYRLRDPKTKEEISGKWCVKVLLKQL